MIIRAGLIRRRGGPKSGVYYNRKQSLCKVSAKIPVPELPEYCITFAHQIPLPSTALSHICAIANSKPAAHAVFFAGVASTKLLAPVFSVQSAHTASHATALERRECLVGVATLAKRDASRRASGSTMWEREEASGWKRDSGEGILSLEHCTGNRGLL